MSVGLGYLKQVLANGSNISFLSEDGLTENDFLDEEIEVLRIIIRYVKNYNKLPSIHVVEAELGKAFPFFPDEPLAYWRDCIIRRTASKLILDKTEQIRKSIVETGDIEKAEEKIRSLYTELITKRKTEEVVHISVAGKEALKVHDEKAKSGSAIEVPFGFPFIDEVTGGAQGGDLISVIGRTGTGKTYTLIKMAGAAYDFGKTPMIITTEMSPVQTVRRILALRTGISPSKMRDGKMSVFDEREKFISEIKGFDRPYYIMKGSLATSLESVILQIREKDPDCIYIDGTYLLKPSDIKGKSTFEQVSAGVTMLKSLAQELNKPIVTTYQIKRKTSGGLEDVYQTDVVAQLSSIVLRVRNAEDATGEEGAWTALQYKTIEILKGREGERGGILVMFDMANMRIEEVEVLREAKRNS